MAGEMAHLYQQPGECRTQQLTPLVRAGLDRTRQLLPFLLSPQGPSPAFIRVVDKYLIIPAADAYTVRLVWCEEGG